MANKYSGQAMLLHDAKRCYVYEYGNGGKITISKRILGSNELDITDALENRDIEIENSKDAKHTMDLLGIVVDEVALSLLTKIIGAFEETNAAPQKVEV